MEKSLYTIEELKAPELLMIKLRHNAQEILIDVLTSIVYKALLEQAASDAWQLANHEHTQLDKEKGHEILFGGDVSTEDEQNEISEGMEEFQNAHAVLTKAHSTIQITDIPGFNEFLQPLLLEILKDIDNQE